VAPAALFSSTPNQIETTPTAAVSHFAGQKNQRCFACISPYFALKSFQNSL
jgi:hypothetical protein